jgi:hypothetical protein
MDTISKSELYYPNKVARLTLVALEGVMGKKELQDVLNLAELSELIDNYPPDDMQREFDYSDLSNINLALENIYGPRGARGYATRSGYASFMGGLHEYGALAGLVDPDFQKLSMNSKLKIGLAALAKIFSMISDQQTTVEEHDEYFSYTIHSCPICWGRKADHPVCFMAAGLVEGCVEWITGGSKLKVAEAACHASGDPACVLHINKDPIS